MVYFRYLILLLSGLLLAGALSAQPAKASRVWQGRLPDSLAAFPSGARVRLPISQTDFRRGLLGRTVWGIRYRDAYRTFIDMPVLDLADAGLIPIRKGGGQQTNSLRLRDSIGREYQLRSVEKDPTRIVPEQFRSDPVLDLVRDQFTASHPLAALAVARLAEAASIYHTHPRLVYLPYQPALGEYDADFGDAVYLLEERPDDIHWMDLGSFGYPNEIIGTEKLLERWQGGYTGWLDANWLLRTRLFDFLLGDWDRHDDQWRWAVTDLGQSQRYRAIPRDRDQAFAHYDGMVLHLLRRSTPPARQWRPYTPNIRAVRWSTYNARIFDHTFLSETTAVDWQDAARQLQMALTDSLIEQAFRESWPELFYQRDAPRIIAHLKARRDNLPAIARAYYLALARRVEVTGSRQDDRFVIEALSDTRTRVSVYPAGRPDAPPRYQRTFFSAQTREIICYGLDGNDRYELVGPGRLSPLLRISGGPGLDSLVRNAPQARHWLTYGLEHGARPGWRRYRPAEYNRNASYYDYNYAGGWPYGGFNPDDGVLLGIGGRAMRFGFGREPYRVRHEFKLLTSWRNGGLYFATHSLWPQAVGALHFVLETQGQTPLYAANFYGLGNTTPNPEIVRGVSYNRVRQQMAQLNAGLRWQPAHHWRLTAGPALSWVEVKNMPDRFIAQWEEGELPDSFFDGQAFAGLDLRLQLDTVDEQRFPARGLRAQIHLGWRKAFSGGDFRYTFADADLAGYWPLDAQRRWVLASRVGGQHRFNRDFPFYAAARLGGFGPEANLRGYRRDRFAGRSAFFHNTELRWKAWTSQNRFLPFSMGMVAAIDYGRVWQPGERRSRWHNGYGGGLFFMPFDAMVFHGGAFRGNDTTRWRIYVSGEFFF